MSSSLLTIKKGKDGLQSIFASGDWRSQNADVLEALLQDAINAPSKRKSVQVDASAITDLDTFGAWLIVRFTRALNEQGIKTPIKGMSDDYIALFAEINQRGLRQAEDTEWLPSSESALVLLQDKIVQTWQELSAFIVLFGASITALFRLLAHPGRFRLTSTVYQFDRVAWKALPIVLLVTFIIGAIIAQQGFFHFRQFGAELYVVNMVGFLIMREIGVLLVAIVVAGRSGSSFTAELGSMKMNEEIDAISTMGFDPVDVLILPRILVLVVALPILTFIGSITALFGAGLVSVFYGGVSAALYIDQLKDIITVTHFNVGMIKAPFIGAAIGVIACAEGLAVRGSASSLGKHTTQSVVKSIFMVIFLDGLFALFFSAIRM